MQLLREAISALAGDLWSSGLSEHQNRAAAQKLHDGGPQIALVAAMAANGVIGMQGGLPWRLPTDLKRFKALTIGKPVIMGRKTWDSIGRPLPGRLNIVVSRNPGFVPAGAIAAANLGDAIAIARKMQPGAGDICVIGGGELYAQALPLAARLYITHVVAEPQGDTWFPPIDPAQWVAVAVEDLAASENDSAAMRFVVYERKSANG